MSPDVAGSACPPQRDTSGILRLAVGALLGCLLAWWLVNGLDTWPTVGHAPQDNAHNDDNYKTNTAVAFALQLALVVPLDPAIEGFVLYP